VRTLRAPRDFVAVHETLLDLSRPASVYGGSPLIEAEHRYRRTSPTRRLAIAEAATTAFSGYRLAITTWRVGAHGATHHRPGGRREREIRLKFTVGGLGRCSTNLYRAGFATHILRAVAFRQSALSHGDGIQRTF
jgi:hypothetical protein